MPASEVFKYMQVYSLLVLKKFIVFDFKARVTALKKPSEMNPILNKDSMHVIYMLSFRHKNDIKMTL